MSVCLILTALLNNPGQWQLRVHLLTGLLAHVMQGSPPPEERSFEDDDGTKFVWDSMLRKFRPEDMATPNAETQQQQPGATAGADAAPVEYTQVLIHHCRA
jgi:hypothetical protein